MERGIINKEVKSPNSTDSNTYKNEFTYLATYSLIKQAEATGEVDIIVLEQLNNRCAERMGLGRYRYKTI